MIGARVREVDIDTDDALVRDFGLRIPVVRVGETIVAEGRITSSPGLWLGLATRRLSRGSR